MSRTGVVAHNGSVKYGSNIYPVRIPAKGSVKLDIAELKYADEYDQYDAVLEIDKIITEKFLSELEKKGRKVIYIIEGNLMNYIKNKGMI